MLQNRTNRRDYGIKVQLVYDYLNQRVDNIDLKEGIRSDQGYKDYWAGIEKDDLLIADLGYFVPDSFKHIHEKKAYFISRYKSDTNLYDAETNQKIDLLEYLDDGGFLLKEVFLGKEVGLKVRLIGYKVTSEQAEHRRRKAHKLAKSHGYTSSSRNQKLLGWSLFITNIPQTKVKAKNIRLLYKLRWKIELLFKLYKSHFRLNKFQTSNPCRRLFTELCHG